MLYGIPATCQHANFMYVINSLIMSLQYVMGKLHSRELSALHIQHSSVMVLFSLNFSTDFYQRLACCTQGCGVKSRLVRSGAMGRDRPPWNGQQCRICWKLLNSSSAESLATHQENSEKCLRWKNTTSTKDASPRCRRHVRATEQAARQGVRIKMQMRPARFHPREAALPATPKSGVVGGATGLHRFPSRRSFENVVRPEGGAEMRTRRRPSSITSWIGLQQGRTTVRTTIRTSVRERSRLLPRADPRSRGSPRRQMCMQLLLLLLRRLLRIVCSAT
jgi:hypothetical protein